MAGARKAQLDATDTGEEAGNPETTRNPSRHRRPSATPVLDGQGELYDAACTVAVGAHRVRG